MHLAGVVVCYRITESVIILARLRRLGKGMRAGRIRRFEVGRVPTLNCGAAPAATFWPSHIFQDVGPANTDDSRLGESPH